MCSDTISSVAILASKQRGVAKLDVALQTDFFESNKGNILLMSNARELHSLLETLEPNLMQYNSCVYRTT